MIRPEAWQVAKPDAHTLSGIVVDTTFVGDRMMVRADTALGEQVIATSGHERLESGERVSLSVAADRLHLIDMQTEPAMQA